VLTWGCVVASLFFVAAVLLFWIAPSVVERALNRRRLPPPYQVRDEVRAVHQSLLVADLHADPLLWKRDLIRRGGHGHVDVPRLIDGNIALQGFGVATSIPWGLNFESNPAGPDMLTALVIIQGWPVRTWRSPFERALYQAEKLGEFVERSEGLFTLVTSRQQLEEFLGRRSERPGLVGGFLALEGVHALEGRLDRLDALYDVGFRMIGLTHFFDNQAGGSAHGMEKGGLSSFGRELVRQVQAKHMVLDLAHASARTIDDVLEMITAPVVVSHTGVRGVCDNLRNLSDLHVRRIAETGGVIGIAMFETAVCGPAISDTARSIRYAADLAGVEALAVGSDWDGAITAPVDASGMALLTGALLDHGFGRDEIGKIMGGNVLRVLSQVLPFQ
jgi:membrane dipeptidase